MSPTFQEKKYSHYGKMTKITFKKYKSRKIETSLLWPNYMISNSQINDNTRKPLASPQNPTISLVDCDSFLSKLKNSRPNKINVGQVFGVFAKVLPISNLIEIKYECCSYCVLSNNLKKIILTAFHLQNAYEQSEYFRTFFILRDKNGLPKNDNHSYLEGFISNMERTLKFSNFKNILSILSQNYLQNGLTLMEIRPLENFFEFRKRWILQHQKQKQIFRDLESNLHVRPSIDFLLFEFKDVNN